MNVNSKYVLICAGDVGGARSLIPVIDNLSKRMINYIIINHGYLGENVPKNISEGKMIENSYALIEKLFNNGQVGTYLFTTSVKDTLALKWARYTKNLKIPTYCLLDSAIRIKDRMQLDNKPTFFPDFMFLQDNESFECAMNDGFNKKNLILSGQPALFDLYEENNKWLQEDRDRLFKKNKWLENKKVILFVSEPVKKDQGSSSKSPQYRGYTEENVISVLCKHLQKFHNKVQISILPHPRDNVNSLLDIFLKYHDKLKFDIFNCSSGREGILFADGIIGMASILLYESWLIGKPTISLQPNIINEDYLYLEKKEGMIVIKEENDFKKIISSWIKIISTSNNCLLRKDELLLHKNSPSKITSVLNQYINN